MADNTFDEEKNWQNVSSSRPKPKREYVASPEELKQKQQKIDNAGLKQSPYDAIVEQVKVVKEGLSNIFSSDTKQKKPGKP